MSALPLAFLISTTTTEYRSTRRDSVTDRNFREEDRKSRSRIYLDRFEWDQMEKEHEKLLAGFIQSSHEDQKWYGFGVPECNRLGWSIKGLDQP